MVKYRRCLQPDTLGALGIGTAQSSFKKYCGPLQLPVDLQSGASFKGLLIYISCVCVLCLE